MNELQRAVSLSNEYLQPGYLSRLEPQYIYNQAQCPLSLGSDYTPSVAAKPSAIAFNPYSFGIMAGMNTVNALVSGYLDKTQHYMNASNYDATANIAIAVLARNAMLSNVELGLNMKDLYAADSFFRGQQVAAHAASGEMDMTTGTKRLIADTARKTENQARDMNMQQFYNYYNQSTETYQRVIQLRGLAKVERQKGKYSGGWGMFSNILTGLLNAAAGSISPSAGSVASPKVG